MNISKPKRINKKLSQLKDLEPGTVFSFFSDPEKEILMVINSRDSRTKTVINMGTNKIEVYAHSRKCIIYEAELKIYGEKE